MSFPVPLDNLITYVRSLTPAGGPLDNLSDAVAVGARLDEQADSLIGHFVDQARRSGASWSQIGTSMGVSKQAAQKRFVPRVDGSDPIPAGQLFSRFTVRTRNVLAAAARLAAPDPVDAGHLVAALPSEPAGLAAKVLHDAGIEDSALYAAFGPGPAPAGDAAPDPRFTADGDAALQGALTAALRLGHNYIGTEHLLLGVLIADVPAAATLTALGLTVESVETAVRAELARITGCGST